jgi:hypothetical protein
MRILSNFKDYYDGVGRYGQDKEIIYIRKKIYPDEKIKDIKFIKLNDNHIKSKEYIKIKHHSSFLIGFCGNFYMGHVIELVTKYSKEKEIIGEIKILYTQKEIDHYKLSKNWIDYNIKGCFEISNHNKLYELFIKYKVPCFVINDYKKQGSFKGNLTLNPFLKKYEFYRIKDSFTAYQEISMFFGGVLPQTSNSMINISDKDKIKKHGFDKWSFKKLPEKKK